MKRSIFWLVLLVSAPAFAANPTGSATDPISVLLQSGSGPVGPLNPFPMYYPKPGGLPVYAMPYQVTYINPDATVLTGSSATTVFAKGHMSAGGIVSATVPYCINFNGTAGYTNGTPPGTWCGGQNTGIPAGVDFAVLPTQSPVSIYGLSAGTASGIGAQ